MVHFQLGLFAAGTRIAWTPVTRLAGEVMAAFTNCGRATTTLEDVVKVPDLGALADLAGLVDVGRLLLERYRWACAGMPAGGFVTVVIGF